MQRACDSCGKPYEAKTKRSRYCGETCKKRGLRAGAVVPLRQVEQPSEELSAVAVTRRVLEDCERLHTPAGVNALLLAAKLDAGGDTGSAMASLSKQHLAALAEATRDVQQAADPVDELRRRREARLKGA